MATDIDFSQIATKRQLLSALQSSVEEDEDTQGVSYECVYCGVQVWHEVLGRWNLNACVVPHTLDCPFTDVHVRLGYRNKLSLPSEVRHSSGLVFVLDHSDVRSPKYRCEKSSIVLYPPWSRWNQRDEWEAEFWDGIDRPFQEHRKTPEEAINEVVDAVNGFCGSLQEGIGITGQ